MLHAQCMLSFDPLMHHWLKWVFPFHCTSNPKYNNAISDAVTDLGGTAEIRALFTGFQKYLYEAHPT